MKSKALKREEAIMRNEKHRAAYEKLFYKTFEIDPDKELNEEMAQRKREFVAHKIGIPKEKHK